jgi:hypothetical protein
MLELTPAYSASDKESDGALVDMIYLGVSSKESALGELIG